jgi:PAS domain S-box-containing protein
MLGYTPDEGLGNTPFSFMPQDEEKRVGEYFLNEVAAKGISFRGLTHKSLTKDGKIVWQKVNGLPMLDKNGKVVGYRGAARDITAEKLAQEELEAAIIKAKTASNAKSQFLANMSHEIRTPMNAIIGLGDMLAQTTNEPKTKDIIDKINSSSKMLLGIINDILDYSKIEAGKLELEKNSFQIEEIFTQLKVMLETKASQKGLEFYFHPKGKDPGVIIGDKLRLTQVLTNLLSNAIKFTNEGNITLTVEFLEKTKENKAKILFNVKDSGIGISKENINRLFKPFSQADNSTTRKYGGTGLGLAISKNIINAMGSDISVQTKEGVGSKFSFVLDFELASHQIDKKGQQELQANVLIVDDQEISRKVLGDILKELDCKFDEAQDGIEAIELIKKADKSKEPYNILLIDWNMPRLNGTQTLRRLQKMYKTKELKNKIPTVFMVSGYSMDEIDFEDIQIERFISKPITPNTLLDALLDTQEGLDKKYLAPKASNTPKIDSLHLLIAEDNELNQEVVSLMLQAVGISFEIANNGKECVEIFAKNQDKFDLILMDLQMPIMGGYEATQKIREFNQKIPIIALTAAAMSEDRDKAIETGMNEHISKPIDKNKLYSIISKYANAKNPKKTQKNQSNKTLNLEYLIDIVGSRERAISLMLKLKEQLSTGEFKNIIHMLKTKDPATQSQIHSLKGVCGNLGLFGIHEILKSIDSQFKNNESISQQSINQLEIALKELLEQLDNLQMQNIAKKENQKISQDELSNLTKRAKQLLFSGEIIEEDMLYTLYENLPIYIQKDELERWKELVEDFEFDEAFKIMEKWDLTKPL